MLLATPMTLTTTHVPYKHKIEIGQEVCAPHRSK